MKEISKNNVEFWCFWSMVQVMFIVSQSFNLIFGWFL